MATSAQMRPVALLATLLLCLPCSSVCVRVIGATGTAMADVMTDAGVYGERTGEYSTIPSPTTDAGVYGERTGEYSTIASPMTEYCATDFSRVSYADVTAACAPESPGASAPCCAAFKAKACQYAALVNDFAGLCPMLFINYLGAAGPYPAGYFVGPCVDGSKGFCTP